MSYWSRLRNALAPGRVEREIEAEIESHLDEGGVTAAEFGGALRYREQSRDAKVAYWLDSLRADVVFAFRQLVKRKTATAVAVVSLAFGIGAVMSAFRLVDAGFLRKLPIPGPERLYFLRYSIVNIDGAMSMRESFSYDEFLAMRGAVKGEAELMMQSFADRQDISYGDPADVEKVSRQFISATMFEQFRIAPAAGRLFGREQDEVGADHRIAVISHDYWTRRFGRAADAVGRTFRYLGSSFTIVGVAEPKFVGTSSGVIIDLFIPLLANAEATQGGGTGMQRQARVLVHVAGGGAAPRIQEKLGAVFQREREALAGRWEMLRNAPAFRQAYLGAKLSVHSAETGISNFNRDLKVPLGILATVAVLVLLLSCASVANLMTIQAAARVREMALRVSIGAGRGRLIQLLLVESLILGLASAALGLLFAWWSAPFVVSRLNPPDNPVRLVLAFDARVAGMFAAVALVVTALFGLLPALRASRVGPAEALKEGGSSTAAGRPPLTLVGIQAAFCVLVCFVAGLLAASLHRLDSQPIGFDSSGVMIADLHHPGEPLPAQTWRQLASRAAALPGVEAAALSGWPLQNGGADIGQIQVGDRPVEIAGPYTIPVANGWFAAMRIPVLEGRDFRQDETGPNAIVNQQFARHYFGGRSPLGESFTGWGQRYQIVGMVGDIRVRDLREAIRPTIYFPHGRSMYGTLVMRVGTGVSMASLNGPLRRLAAAEFPSVRVENTRTQEDAILVQTVRERLLAALSGFFAVVALVLAGLGLYGVLSHAVWRRAREFAIRMALGARPFRVAGGAVRDSALAFGLGASAGLAGGFAIERMLRAFLFQTTGADPLVLGPVLLSLLLSGLIAAAVPVARAVRIDPARSLRAE